MSGIYALNLGDRVETPGDWHFSALDWTRPTILDSDGSPFGEWGIREDDVPGIGRMPVADHARACLDLIAGGHFGEAQGMRDNFISNDSYDRPIMSQAWKLRDSERWPQIDRFMGHEYLCKWLDFKEGEDEWT
ncbi:hypothetical protein [Bifidobacterium aerophilum]|uniref:hypothetical protein n=1 Tax=Bifidobacterium aerophilum TaxID=1798155 RepID=UPI0013D068AC|nr:hypothetical protein [Bifidobacterium aerophilum]